MHTLLQQLTDTDHTTRYNAAQALGKQGDVRAVDGLVAALNDNNPKVKYAALSSLVKIGSPAAATPTIEALLDDLDSRLWKLLVLDIGMRLRNGLFNMIEPGNAAAAKLLTDALDNAELGDHQRALVVRLIGRTKDTDRLDTFIDMMMIASDTLQGAAAEALGYIGDERAIDPLLTVLEDSDSAVREIVINALARIGNPQVGDAILPYLDSHDEWTRRAAAAALGTLNDRRAVRKLLRMQREDDSQVVREAAGDALTRLILPGDNSTNSESS